MLRTARKTHYFIIIMRKIGTDFSVPSPFFFSSFAFAVVLFQTVDPMQCIDILYICRRMESTKNTLSGSAAGASSEVSKRVRSPEQVSRAKLKRVESFAALPSEEK